MRQHADTIYISDAIFTGNSLKPISGALAVSGKHILAVGSFEDMAEYTDADTKIIPCQDKLILPGFHDSHVHFVYGAMQNDEDLGFDLSDCTSLAQCVERAKKFADMHPENQWVYGKGWNEVSWVGGELPSRELLDEAIPDRPVYLASWDLHSGLVNKKALERMGWDRSTPDLEDSTLGRYEDGELTGLIREPGYLKPVNNAALQCPDLPKTVAKAIKTANAYGITSLGVVHPYGSLSEEETVDLFKQMEEDHLLTLRIHLFMELKEDLTEVKKTEKRCDSDMFHVSGLKLITDGVCESYTGYLSEPYADNPSTCGELQIGAERLTKLLLHADAEGYSVRLHTIGNGAVNNALNCFEKVMAANGNKGLHHALEHIESCKPEDIDRISKMGIMASMQPVHAILNVDGYPKLLGEKWIPYMWPIKTLIDAGATYCLGTDYPVVGLNPMEGIHAAITRQSPSGYPDGGFVPKQKISLGQALQGYTYGSALVANYQDKIGTLTEGKYADFIIMDRNLFTCSPEEILDAVVEKTFVGGKLVYSRT